MKVLVTGANGFIGSNLAKACLNKKHDILAISRNTTNISCYKNKQCNIQDIDTLTKDITTFKPNVVIHCAWDGGNSYTDINDKKQFNNVTNSLKLLDTISSLKNIHFICIGSAAEYGNYNDQINENFIEHPISFYGVSKFSFKMLSNIFCKKHDILWSWVRPFYTYGPHDVATRLIPKTIISCLKNEKIELNSCNSIIDYLYIDDFVDGLVNIFENKFVGVYNICSGKQYEIKTIINKIQKLCKNNSSIAFNKNFDREKFPNYICGDSSKLIKQSNNKWYPKINLDDGLTKTIMHYETILNN